MSQDHLFLAVCRQGDDKSPASVTINPAFFHAASKDCDRVVSLDDGKALPLVKLDSGAIKGVGELRNPGGRAALDNDPRPVCLRQSGSIHLRMHGGRRRRLRSSRGPSTCGEIKMDRDVREASGMLPDGIDLADHALPPVPPLRHTKRLEIEATTKRVLYRHSGFLCFRGKQLRLSNSPPAGEKSMKRSKSMRPSPRQNGF